MRYDQFAILNCNIFLCAGYITNKIGPLILAIGWFAVLFYMMYTERKYKKLEQK